MDCSHSILESIGTPIPPRKGGLRGVRFAASRCHREAQFKFESRDYSNASFVMRPAPRPTRPGRRERRDVDDWFARCDRRGGCRPVATPADAEGIGRVGTHGVHVAELERVGAGHRTGRPGAPPSVVRTKVPPVPLSCTVINQVEVGPVTTSSGTCSSAWMAIIHSHVPSTSGAPPDRGSPRGFGWAVHSST